MELKYVLILILILPIVSASSIRINEIMYNPEGNDYDFEYIELYGEGENISEWHFEGISFTFPANTIINGYLVIANTLNDPGDNNDFLDRYPGVSCNFEYSGSLLNEGELISLWNKSELVEALHYYSELGGDGNNKSLCNLYNVWQECSATPGSENIEVSINYNIRINEFLPDPIGDDNDLMPDGEWVELYNFGDEINLEEFYLKDNSGRELIISDTNTLSGTIIEANNYLVVYMNGFYGLLNNDFDKISLYKENNLIDSVSYSDSEINKSFSKIDNTWVKSVPTPNKENEPIIIIEQDYTKLKINELFPDPEGSDATSMPNGEFVELYNSGSSALDLENLSLKDNYGQDMDIYISDSNTMSGTVISANSYLVVYMNGRFGFLNNDGYERIILYKEDYLLDDVSYSGSSEGLTWSKIEDKWILSLPTPGSQNYNNESDVTISNLKVDRIYDLGSDDIAKFGQIIRIKLLVYKGDTNKESIKLYVEDKDGERISKESKVNVGDKFTNYTFTAPIQLIPNCKRKFEDGEYFIVISGLDDTDREEIEIKEITPSLCETITEYKETIKTSVSSDSENVLKSEYVTGNVIYEGKSEKQGRYAVYFFVFSLIMLIIYLMWKNE